MSQSPSKILFGNVVNGLMTGCVSSSHARTLASVSHRKIWLADENDLLVIDSPLCERFKKYACGLLGIDGDTITAISPKGPPWSFLSERLRADPDALNNLRCWLAEKEGIVAQCFALDEPAVTFFRELGVSFDGYIAPPSEEIVALIFKLNSKSGFRELAHSLGIRTPEGRLFRSMQELAEGLSTYFQGMRTIIKFDRSSNGYGNVLLDRCANPEVQLQQLSQYMLAWPEQPHHFIVEELIDWVAAPSVELSITVSGVEELYICDQRCINYAWSGMITPPKDLSESAILELKRIGSIFGTWVWQRGYRGICDVDCLFDTNGQLYATETNFRRTGGTYLDTLVKRLLAKDHIDRSVWIADVADASAFTDFFCAIEKLRKGGLLFDRDSKSGIILTANTLSLDGKWRYLIIGWDFSQVEYLETKLFEILGI